MVEPCPWGGCCHEPRRAAGVRCPVGRTAPPIRLPRGRGGPPLPARLCCRRPAPRPRAADPAGGSAPGYHFTSHGGRRGVLVMRHKDGPPYSCLPGVAFAGPRRGERLTPVPTLTSTWGVWTRRYPHAVAYQMFDKYRPV